MHEQSSNLVILRMLYCYTNRFLIYKFREIPSIKRSLTSSQLHHPTNQTHLYTLISTKTQKGLYFATQEPSFQQKLPKSSTCSSPKPLSPSLSASLSMPCPSRTPTSVATRSALPTKPSAARSLSTEWPSSAALLNARPSKLLSVENHTQTNAAIKFAPQTSPNAAR